MKLVGIIFFIIGSMVFLKFNETETKNKIKKSEDLIRLLYLIKMNVLENKSVLKEAFLSAKGMISDYIDIFLTENILNANEDNIRKSITDEMYRYFSDSDVGILECVIKYIMLLGTTDKDTAVRNFNLTQKECEKLIVEMKEERKKTLRLSKTITYGIVSAVVIVLI